MPRRRIAGVAGINAGGGGGHVCSSSRTSAALVAVAAPFVERRSQWRVGAGTTAHARRRHVRRARVIPRR